MSDVKFNEPQYSIRKQSRLTNKFSDFLKRRKIVKNEKQAKYVLVTIVVISILITIYALFFNNGLQEEIILPAGQIVPK